MARPTNNTNNTTAKKGYNLSVTPMYRNKVGFSSIVITDDIVEKLRAVRPGGKLLVKVRPEQYVKSETDPQAYMEYLSPEDLQTLRDNYNSQKNSPPEDSL